MSRTTRMSCAACHYAQLIPFPSITVEGKPDAAYGKRALEVESLPLPQFGDNVVAVDKRTIFYACPNCGTLRIRIKTLD